MTEPYDVGVLIHFPEAVSEQLEIELIELASKWDAHAETGWPFGVAILPVGEYLMFVFEDPGQRESVHRARRETPAGRERHGITADQLYTIVMCWTGVLGGEQG